MIGIKRIVVELPADMKDSLDARVRFLKENTNIKTTKQYIMDLIKYDIKNNVIFFNKKGS